MSDPRPIWGHGKRPAAELLAETTAWCAERGIANDLYGDGEMINGFEGEVASRLGFAAARFLPSGTMAQQIALRVWSDRAGCHHVGMHPTSHLELHEQRGYHHLHGLGVTLVGPRDRPLLAEHLAEVPERLSALLFELPIREAGGQLPTWEQLAELKAAARERGVALHLDGARLWECAAGYDRGLSEICEGVDSCYVSFYKGIGALPGCMLLGPADFIDEAIVWQRRSGGNLVSMTANAASASMQLETRLARMPAHLERARALARTLGGIDGISILPDPPQVNMMHVFLALAPEAATAARDRIAEERGLKLFGRARPCDVPGHSRFELYVGEATMAIEIDEIAAGFRDLFA